MTNQPGTGKHDLQGTKPDRKVHLQISDSSLADMVEITLKLDGIPIDKETSQDPGLLITDPTGYATADTGDYQDRILLLITDEGDIPEGIEYLVVPLQGDSHDLDPVLLVRKVQEMLSGRRPSTEKNPVTGLPGAAAFEAELRERISTGERFGVIFADLNHFRSYNKAYSYSRGDQMLIAVGDLMKRAFEKNPNPQNFLAHLSNDDFTLITSESIAPIIAEEIVDSFDEMVSQFYDVADLSRGNVIVTNRKGKEVVYPIVTIALAVILSSRRALSHAAEALDLADELLEYLKSRDVTESCCIVERRTGK
jgi:GGDEF domain-containing protein